MIDRRDCAECSAMRKRPFPASLRFAGGAMRMSGRVRVMKLWLVMGPLLLGGCETANVQTSHLIGIWGGPHAGLNLQGGLGDVQFDCASGTIDDPFYPGPDGSFSVKGTYRTGAPGPVRVGQFFKSQGATYAGQVTRGTAKNASRVMTLHVALEDGTTLGPFTLDEGAPPQL